MVRECSMTEEGRRIDDFLVGGWGGVGDGALPA